VPEKGIEIQLEAFRIIPEQKLLIVGSSKDKDISYFQKLVRAAP
jgi:glycosyltransferase involved in cell wall biosynthesis